MEVLKQKITPFSVSPSQPPDLFFFSCGDQCCTLERKMFFFVCRKQSNFWKVYTYFVFEDQL